MAGEDDVGLAVRAKFSQFGHELHSLKTADRLAQLQLHRRELGCEDEDQVSIHGFLPLLGTGVFRLGFNILA